MKDKNKYSEAGNAINLIVDFTTELEEKLKNCENKISAKNARDLLISNFNEACSSGIIKKHLFNESEMMINRKYNNV